MNEYLETDNFYGGLNNFRALSKRALFLKNSINSGQNSTSLIFPQTCNQSFGFEGKKPLDGMSSVDDPQDAHTFLPHTEVMLPFLPNVHQNDENANSTDAFYAVSGGRAKMAPSIENLLKELPQKSLYQGPYVKINSLVNIFASLPQNLQIRDERKPREIDEGTMYSIELASKNKKKSSYEISNTSNSLQSKRIKVYSDVFFRRKYANAV